MPLGFTEAGSSASLKMRLTVVKIDTPTAVLPGDTFATKGSFSSSAMLPRSSTWPLLARLARTRARPSKLIAVASTRKGPRGIFSSRKKPSASVRSTARPGSGLAELKVSNTSRPGTGTGSAGTPRPTRMVPTARTMRPWTVPLGVRTKSAVSAWPLCVISPL